MAKLNDTWRQRLYAMIAEGKVEVYQGKWHCDDLMERLERYGKG